MPKTYKVVEPSFGETYLEMTDDDGTIRFVPMVEDNSDYQEYLNPSEAKTI
jgi:hypothetical protein